MNMLILDFLFNAGNEHRLGGNEAPPAIISVFIGDQLEMLYSNLLKLVEATSSKKSGKFSVGVHRIPEFAKRYYS